METKIKLFTNKQHESMLSRNKSFKSYGKAIKVTLGLIIGLVIDKTLFIVSKGLSVFIPPFAVMLINKGLVLKEIRFEKDLGILNKLVDHIIVK
jgi:hypothetical protein